MRWRKPIGAILLIFLLTMLYVTVLNTWRDWFDKKPSKVNDGLQEYFQDEVITGLNFSTLKVVHLDLKGAPPKLHYLKKVLPIIAAVGIDTILVEYEDTFPYYGMIENISAVNSYTKEEIKEFLGYCEYLGLDVIPLVQTFGHMEFVLKLLEFRHLRELDENPQDICPSNEYSIVVIKEILRQIMELHVKSKIIHIGCDEVFTLNICPKCRKQRLNPRKLYVEHIKIIASFIKESYPGMTVLIWDDMLRHYVQHLSDIKELVEPVIWVYGNDIIKTVPHRDWYWYFQKFKNIWVAGAYKGASGEIALLSNITLHINNQQSWIKFLRNYVKPPNKIVGYILTGWSRYDHFAILCEMLPVSMPSLILNSILISRHGNIENILSTFNAALKCKYDKLQDIIHLENVENCSFPGKEILLLVQQLISLQSYVNELYIKLNDQNAWLSNYHYKYNLTNPNKLKTLFGRKFNTVRKHFKLFKITMKIEMMKYFHENTAIEWLEEYAEPYENKLDDLKRKMRSLVKKRTWTRRIL